MIKFLKSHIIVFYVCFAIILLEFPIYLFSLPQVDKVINGNVSFTKSINQMIINQKDPKAIIDWKDFSLDEKESLRINQEENFSILNRVITNNISKIYGSIQADGKFYLINQNGILIGPNGSINANKVVLSTLELSNNNFLKKNNLQFSSFKNGKINNLGSIKAAHSDIMILSKDIKNKGKIIAKKGKANLIASSDTVILDKKNDIIIKPNQNCSITNKGKIQASFVKLLSNNNDLASYAINQKGLIEARGIKKKDGKVILISEKGIINNTKTLIAKNLDKSGGKVKILAEHIVLNEDSKIDVSNTKMGGKVLIGKKFQKKDSKINNAKTVFVSKKANIYADATENGNGGNVIVWADKSNQFYGNISAKGGKNNGDGGFVEVSCKKYLDFQGLVDTTSLNRTKGMLLLDPFDVTIVALTDNNITGAPNFHPTGTGAQLSAATILSNLALGDVSLNTSGGGGAEPGNITVSAPIAWTIETGNLTFIADNNIIVNSNITWSSSSNLSLIAANNISFSTLSSLLIGGVSASGDILLRMNSITSSSGINFQSSGNINFQTATKSTTIGIGDSAAGNLLINNTIISSLLNGFNLITIGDATQSGVVDLDNATFLDPVEIFSDQIDVSNSFSTSGDITFNIGLTQDGILNLNAFVTATGGNFSVNGSTQSSDTFNINIDPSSQTASFDAKTIDVDDINTINGPSLAKASIVDWVISGVNSGTIGNITFSNITDCIAKDTDDTFTVESSGFMDNVDLGLGSNVLTINNGGEIGVLQGGSGDVTYNLSGTVSEIIASSGTNIFNINTNASISQITSGNGDNTYNINGGDVTSTIVTGTGDDIFNFSDNQGLTVTNGVTFATTGAKELNYSAYANTRRIFVNLSDETITLTDVPLTMNPKSTTGFNSGAANTLINPTNLTNIVGNNPLALNTSESELVGPASTWEVTGINSGTVDGIPYAAMPNINGTNNDDIFNFSATGTQDRVRGLGGNDAFNFGFSAGSPAAWTGDITTQAQGGPGNDIFTFYKDVNITATLDGGPGGTNEIKGPPIDAGNLSTAWIVSSANSGSLQPSGAVAATNFSAIDVLTGSDRDDTFTITHTNAQTLSIDGDTGTNKIIGPAPGVGANTWTITANNGGTLNVGNPPQLISFSNISFLEGNTGDDDFIFNGAFSISGSFGIDGKTGINSVTGADGNRNDWNITADDTGKINIDPLNTAATTTFQNIQNLFGGNNVDNFIFDGAFQISGATAIDGQGGINTITGPNVSNTWNISAADTGQISPFGATGPTLFTSSGTLNLVGRTQADSFTFALGSSLSGSIDGINAALNSIDVSATVSAIVSVEPGSGIILGGIDNIQTITGNATTTFIARNAANLWTINVNDGALVTNAIDNITLINIPFFEGGSSSDIFNFTGNFAISGSINGKAGTNTIIAATGVDNTWTITDNNAGTLSPSSGSTTIFSNIQNLTGNISTQDIFILFDGKGLSGTVDGGSCNEGNTLDYSLYTQYAFSSMPPCSAGPGTATNIGAIRYIDIFIPPPIINLAFEKAINSEVYVIYDLTNFAEFNNFLNIYHLIYLKKESLNKFLIFRADFNKSLIQKIDKSEIIYPKYQNLIFKDLKKD